MRSAAIAAKVRDCIAKDLDRQARTRAGRLGMTGGGAAGGHRGRRPRRRRRRRLCASASRRSEARRRRAPRSRSKPSRAGWPKSTWATSANSTTPLKGVSARRDRGRCESTRDGRSACRALDGRCAPASSDVRFDSSVPSREGPSLPLCRRKGDGRRAGRRRRG
jgi:hypothetical protein